MSLFRKARDNGCLLLLSTGSIVLTITLAVGVTIGLPLLKVQPEIKVKPCELVKDTDGRRIGFQEPVSECDLVQPTPIISGHQFEIINADSLEPSNLPPQNVKPSRPISAIASVGNISLLDQSVNLIPNRTEINQAIKFVGKYERIPVENDWHKVKLVIENNRLMWQNAAKVSWPMSFKNNLLRKADNLAYPAQVELNRKHIN